MKFSRQNAMRYPWPDGKQSAAVLSFDFDAESGFLFREPEKAKRSLADLEERRFGPRVGVDRILRMLDRLRLRASFYIPGWTVENHLPQCKRIRDAGHEIGAHGNVHEAVAALDQAQEKAVLAEQLRILADHLGVRPAGYRSPSWDVNVWTPGLLKTHGFRYDSSLMGNDVPYDVATPKGRSPRFRCSGSWTTRRCFATCTARPMPSPILAACCRCGARNSSRCTARTAASC
jgi:peptidoglycan/xylan/chitin deacetylase (PgdA/CDA1 family)